MDYHGNINLLDNEMQRMVLSQESSFPQTPTPGRILFTNKRLYFCVEIVAGVPAWIPLTNEISTYVHEQGAASQVWNVSHNLGTTTPIVQVYDNEQKLIITDDIEVIDNNNVTVSLGAAAAGRAVVMFGSITGSEKQDFSATIFQTTPSDTWVLSHNLGYFPVVRVFVGNEELQPQSIVHDTMFQTTISFNTLLVGVARFI